MAYTGNSHTSIMYVILNLFAIPHIDMELTIEGKDHWK